MTTKTKNLKKDQTGIASLVIVILIMTLLTLIVLALAKNANREQRQSLDRQLNNQAFYAAESGVNDAQDYVAQQGAANVPEEKTDCDKVSANPNEYFTGIPKSFGDENDGVAYSCVLYDLTPEELIFDSVAGDTSKYVAISNAGGGTLKTLKFTWSQRGGGSDFSGCPGGAYDFPQQLTNCDAGVLRLALISNTGSSRQDLIDNMFLAFATPSNRPPVTHNYGQAAGAPNYQGKSFQGGCNTNNECSLTIKDINKTRLYLHLRSLYKNSSVRITGTVDVDGSTQSIQFKDAQMVIDSTGRATDVLKRIKTSISLDGVNNKVRPEFVLQTAGDICKQLVVKPTFVEDNCN